MVDRLNGGATDRATFGNMPEPPPDNRGTDGTGRPPRRDRRRSRAQGDNLIISGLALPTAPTGGQSWVGATTGQICSFDTGSDEAGDESQTLIAFLKAYDFAENAVTGIAEGSVDPFKGVATPISGTAPSPLLQSLIVLAELQWGHDGVTKKVVCNLCAGQVIKAGLAGTYARAKATLSCKYLQRFEDAPAGGTDMFHYIDPDPNIRNNIWNSINSPALNPLLGYDRDTAPLTPVHVDGILALGDCVVPQGGSFDRSSRPTRRFFGSYPAEAAGYPGHGAFVFCPIAFGASAVMLQANATQFTNPAAQNFSPLLMGMIDHSGNITAQIVPNTFFPLTSECQQIFVYGTGVNSAENPFTLIYDLGL